MVKQAGLGTAGSSWRLHALACPSLIAAQPHISDAPDAAASTAVCCHSQVASKGCHQLPPGPSPDAAASAACPRRRAAPVGCLRAVVRGLAAGVHLCANRVANCVLGAAGHAFVEWSAHSISPGNQQTNEVRVINRGTAMNPGTAYRSGDCHPGAAAPYRKARRTSRIALCSVLFIMLTSGAERQLRESAGGSQRQ